MKQQLIDLRNALLALHKTLLDTERASYEKDVGPITSPGHFLQLLTTDPRFAWLRAISLHIVTIDEATDSKRNPLTDEAALGLIHLSAQLIANLETAPESADRYRTALQASPFVQAAHDKAASLAKIG